MKYVKHGETISVDLGNGYSVFAMAAWDKEDREYKVTLYIQHNRVELLKPLQDAIDIPIQAKKNTLYSEVGKYIENLVEEHFFRKHIQTYDFELKCFDKGIELLVDRDIAVEDTNENHQSV